MSGLSLRRAGPEEAEAFALVGAATFLESFADALPGQPLIEHCVREHSAARYADLLSAPDAAAWLVETETGAPVGYALACAPDLPLANLGPTDWELKRIYLFSQRQRGGLGRRILEAVLGEAHDRARRRIVLGVYEKNAAAIAFYRRTGFVEAGRRAFMVGQLKCEDLIFARAVGPERENSHDQTVT